MSSSLSAAVGTHGGEECPGRAPEPLLSHSTGSSLGSVFPACLPTCSAAEAGLAGFSGTSQGGPGAGLQNDLKQNHLIALCNCTGFRTF